MVALYPVGGSMRDKHGSTVIDASTRPAYRTRIGLCARTYRISFFQNQSSHIIWQRSSQRTMPNQKGAISLHTKTNEPVDHV